MKDIYDESINQIEVIKCGTVELEWGLNKYDYYIVSIRGNHPCAYIALEQDDVLYGRDIEDELPLVVHGGITYCQKGVQFNGVEDNRWIIGWDYAHAGDFTRMLLESDNWGDETGKKYSIGEIMKDIFEMAKFLNEVNSIM